jgi:hypothetical protein
MPYKAACWVHDARPPQYYLKGFALDPIPHPSGNNPKADVIMD